jgi:hypothetical protein
MTMLNFRQFLESVPENFRKLVIFDFDDTLVFTPPPEEGIPNYEKATGKAWMIPDKDTALAHGFPKDFRRIGWWGRKETLHPPIFEPSPERLNVPVANALRGFHADPETYTVVMTGRVAHAEERVKEILAHYGVHANRYFFQGQKELTQNPNYPKRQDTFNYKAFVITDVLMGPNIESVEIFDDREEHIPKFVELGENLKKRWPNLKTVIIHDVRQNKIVNI